MSKPKISNAGHDRSSVPVFYADQIAALAMSPYVCRLTFGVIEDDGTDYPRPVVTVAIPTVSLLRMVSELTSTLNNPELKKELTASLTEAAQWLAAGATSHAAGEEQETLSSKKPKRLKSSPAA